MGSSGPSLKTSRRLLMQVPLPQYRLRGEPLLSDEAVGVGNHPYSAPPMPGANVGSWNVMPFRIIPDLGQVSENSAKPSARPLTWASKQVCDVLQENELRSYFANKSRDFRPKAGSGSVSETSALSGNADVLAREAPADDIDSNSVSVQSVGCECSDIVVLPHMGPVLRQDAAAERIDLAERDRLEAARALKAQVETADTCKQGEDAQLAHCIPAASSAGVRYVMRKVTYSEPTCSPVKGSS